MLLYRQAQHGVYFVLSGSWFPFWKGCGFNIKGVIFMINPRKAAIIGCGFVGSSIAFSRMQRVLFAEMLLIDANQEKAVGEAMDLSLSLIHI